MYFCLVTWEECLLDDESCRRFRNRSASICGVISLKDYCPQRSFQRLPTLASERVQSILRMHVYCTLGKVPSGTATSIFSRPSCLFASSRKAVRKLWGLRGMVWVDSMVALQALNSGRSKNVLITAAAREYKLLCLRVSTQIWVAHIPTLENLEADYISRGVWGGGSRIGGSHHVVCGSSAIMSAAGFMWMPLLLRLETTVRLRCFVL